MKTTCIFSTNQKHNPDKTLRLYPQKIPGQNKYLCPAYQISTQDYDIEAPNSHQRSW